MSKLFHNLHKYNPNQVVEVANDHRLDVENIDGVYGAINDHMIYSTKGDIVELVVTFKNGTAHTYDAVWPTNDGMTYFESIEALEQGITIDKLVAVW